MKLTRETAFTPLNLHIVIVVILAVVNLVFATRLLLAWHTVHADSSEQIAQDQAQLRTLQVQTQSLRGLPEKVVLSREQAASFYQKRMPSDYSPLIEELGNLAQKNGVRMTRVQYAQAPVFRDLAEVRMDASVSGEYTPVMRYINALERDKMFFVINAVTLTGSQGGQVNVRLRLTTYLHGPEVNRIAPPAIEGTQGTNTPGEGQ